MGSKTLYAAAVVLATAVRVYGDVPFLTELEIFSQLAPCVASAVTNAYLWEQDTTACGSEPTKLQSCICTSSAELNKMTQSVSSAVSSRCGTQADDDQASAAQLVDKYCHPDKTTITFATPTTNIIPGVMSDVAAISSLPPCVQSGLSAAVNAAAYDGCPTVANMWAPCACSKKNVVGQINASLGQEVRKSCSNADDVTLASSFYTQFCAMNEGTTSFAAMPGPPGDMSYYITALPQFSSLRPCAQSGIVEAVMSQSTYLCAAGPQALASCVCLKPGILGKASQSLTSSVKYNCDNTALADVSSAAGVLEYYCQAAQNKVVATVSQSVSETTKAASTRPTASRSSGAPQRTGAANNSGSTPSTDSKSGGDGSVRGLGKGAIIAIAVLGALVVIGLLVLMAIFIRRRHRKAKGAAETAADVATGQAPYHPPKSELAADSPSSEMDGKSPFAPPAVSASPLHDNPHAELSGAFQPRIHQAVSPSELSSPGSQLSQGHDSPHDSRQNWERPAQAIYELDSAPHAR